MFRNTLFSTSVYYQPTISAKRLSHFRFGPIKSDTFHPSDVVAYMAKNPGLQYSDRTLKRLESHMTGICQFDDHRKYYLANIIGLATRSPNLFTLANKYFLMNEKIVAISVKNNFQEIKNYLENTSGSILDLYIKLGDETLKKFHRINEEKFGDKILISPFSIEEIDHIQHLQEKIIDIVNSVEGGANPIGYLHHIPSLLHAEPYTNGKKYK